MSARTDYNFSIMFDPKHVVTEKNTGLTLRWLNNYLHPEWRAYVVEADSNLGKHIRVLDGDMNVWCRVIPGCTLYAEPWQILVLDCAERMATMMISPEATLYLQRVGIAECTPIKIQVSTENPALARATRDGIWRNMGAMKERQAGLVPEAKPILKVCHADEVEPYILVGGRKIETGATIVLDASSDQRITVMTSSQEPLFTSSNSFAGVTSD